MQSGKWPFEMGKAIQVKWKLAFPIGTIVFVVVYILIGYTLDAYQRWGDVLRSSECTTAYLSHPAIKQSLKYCNTVKKEAISGMEGTTEMDFYNLELVQVVIRHGDRAPIHTMPNYKFPTIPCGEHEELTQVAPFYSSFKSSMSKEKVQRISGQSFANWDLFPNKEVCTASLLTPEGAAQHIRNGQHFNKVYIEKLKLLQSEAAWDQVKLITTTKSRTFQSGIAFMYGFLPNLNPHKLNIEAALDNKMCLKSTKLSCGCPAITPFIDLMSTTWRQNYPEFTDNKMLRTAYEDIANAMGTTTKELPRASHLFDIHMVHACHGLPLPGIEGGKCVQPGSLLSIHRALNKNGIANQKSIPFKRVSRLKMMPLLYDIFKRMEGLNEGETKEKFILYSGHDTTLEPLISTLGITNGTWPPYASRLVFETYSFDHGGHKHYLLRILFNGIDVTPRTIFCKPEDDETILNDDGLCPLDEFASFINENSMKDIHKTKNYRELCTEKVN